MLVSQLQTKAIQQDPMPAQQVITHNPEGMLVL